MAWCRLQEILRMRPRRINHLRQIRTRKPAKSYRDCWENRAISTGIRAKVYRCGLAQIPHELGIRCQHASQLEEPFEQLLLIIEGHGQEARLERDTGRHAG